MQTAKRHVAGTVCVGFSRRGAGLFVSDPTVVSTLAWCALRRACQENKILQENARCPVSLFAQMLEDLYFVDVVELDAMQFGWSCARGGRVPEPVNS